MNLADSVDVFYGPLSPAAAPLFVRIDQLPGGAAWTVFGQVRGPICGRARTLPATFALRDLGAGPTLLARAMVTDPCFWSPTLPALYAVTLEIRQADSVVERVERRIGFRNLGADRQNLVWEGKRWVLRGVLADSSPDEPIVAWREAAAAQIINHPDCGLCREADEQGVLLAACIDGSPSQRLAETRRLARYASVGFLIDLGDEPLASDPRHVAPNVLHSQWLSADEEIKPAPWAQVAFCDSATLHRFAQQAASATIPVVATRRLPHPAPLPAARAACDLLQRDLAPHGDFAGYVV